MRPYRRLAIATLTTLAITIPTAATPSETPPDRTAVTLVSAEFRPYTPDARAITHDPRVPPGAHAKVLALASPAGTLVTLTSTTPTPAKATPASPAPA